MRSNRGATGTNTSTIINTRILNKTTKNCNNCSYCKNKEYSKRIFCNMFKMGMDSSNAKVCSKYTNKHNKTKKRKAR